MNKYLITVDLNDNFFLNFGKMKKIQICNGYLESNKKTDLMGFCCLYYCSKILEEVEHVEKADLTIVM